MLATDKMDLPVRLLMFSETSLQKRQLRFLLFGAFLAVGIIAAMIRPAFLAPRGFAKPAYMDRYNRDPYARSEWIDKCTVCHVGRGGAERNEFGEAFEYAGYRITPKLRAKFPKLFVHEPK